MNRLVAKTLWIVLFAALAAGMLFVVRGTESAAAEEKPAAGQRVRFALCQLDSREGDIPGNVRRALAMAEKAADAGAAVVVFPEFSFVSLRDLMRRAVPDLGQVPGGLEKLSAFAKRRGCWLVANHPGNEGGRWYNESIVLSPEGTVFARYRKRELAIFDRQIGMSPGTEATVAALPFAKVGLLICKDVSYPETYEKDCADADLLVMQFAHVRTKEGADGNPRRNPFARTPESLEEMTARCHGVSGKTQLLADKTGTEGPWSFDGGTRVVAADGATVAKLDRETGFVFADFPLGEDGRIDSAAPAAEIRAWPGE